MKAVDFSAEKYTCQMMGCCWPSDKNYWSSRESFGTLVLPLTSPVPVGKPLVWPTRLLEARLLGRLTKYELRKHTVVVFVANMPNLYLIRQIQVVGYSARQQAWSLWKCQCCEKSFWSKEAKGTRQQHEMYGLVWFLGLKRQNKTKQESYKKHYWGS